MERSTTPLSHSLEAAKEVSWAGVIILRRSQRAGLCKRSRNLDLMLLFLATVASDLTFYFSPTLLLAIQRWLYVVPLLVCFSRL